MIPTWKIYVLHEYANSLPPGEAKEEVESAVKNYKKSDKESCETVKAWFAEACEWAVKNRPYLDPGVWKKINEMMLEKRKTKTPYNHLRVSDAVFNMKSAVSEYDHIVRELLDKVGRDNVVELATMHENLTRRAGSYVNEIERNILQ